MARKSAHLLPSRQKGNQSVTEDVAYVAGLFEGEGSITVWLNHKSVLAVRVCITSTDLDVLEKVQRIVGFGNIYAHAKVNGNKQCWNWTVNRREDVWRFLDSIEHLLGQRRRAKIAETRSKFDGS